MEPFKSSLCPNFHDMVKVCAIKTAVNLSTMNPIQCCCCFTSTVGLEKLCGPALDAYSSICSSQDMKNGDTGMITCLGCREFLKEIHRFRIADVEDIKPNKDELTRNDAIEGNSSKRYIKTEPIDEYVGVNQIDIQINKVEVDLDAENLQQISKTSSEYRLVPNTWKCEDRFHYSVNSNRDNLLIESYHTENCVTDGIAQEMIPKSAGKENNINSTERLFKCDKCAFECNEKQNMAIHKNIHSKIESIDKNYSDNELFYCDTCDFNTHRKSTLINHVKTHLGHKPYKCSDCSYASINVYSLRRHIKFRHSEEKPFTVYVCDQCNYNTKIKDKLAVHKRKHSKDSIDDFKFPKILNRHSDKGLFYCDHCNVSCKTKQYLGIHMKKHLGYKPYKCSECSYATITVEYLKRHIATKHSDERPFTCDQCDHSTKCKYRLASHKKLHLKDRRKTLHNRKKRSDIGPFYCDHCTYSTKNKQCLAVHVRKHMGYKPFKCTKCSYATINRNCLKMHIIHKHIDEKPFSCDQCDFSTKTKSQLALHKRNHLKGSVKNLESDERSFTTMLNSDKNKFQCDQCSYSNKNKQCLDIHARKHLGYKPYKCTECSYATINVACLRRHVIYKHSDERPFSCDQCDYRAKTKCLLNVHKKIHSKVSSEMLNPVNAHEKHALNSKNAHSV